MERNDSASFAIEHGIPLTVYDFDLCLLFRPGPPKQLTGPDCVISILSELVLKSLSSGSARGSYLGLAPYGMSSGLIAKEKKIAAFLCFRDLNSAHFTLGDQIEVIISSVCSTN